MANQYVEIGLVRETKRGAKYDALERFFLRRAHPVRMFFDMASLPWVVYFLWNQNWPYAMGVFVLGSVLGLMATRRVDCDKMASTFLGRVALLHLTPFNITTQLIALFPTVYGLWVHSTEFILIGVSLLFIGHITGWGEVDERFSLETES